jgi:hypothetical protein
LPLTQTESIKPNIEESFAGISLLLLLGLGVVAQDLVGWCRGEDHPRVTIHPARQHLDKLVLASYCLLDKARINLKRQRRRYQTQERKRHPHKCNRANFLPRFPPQDIVSTTAVLKNITATRKTTTVKEGEPGFFALATNREGQAKYRRRY